MKHVIETFKSAFGGRFVLVMMGFVPAIYLFLVFFTGGIDAYKLFTFIIAPLIFCLFCFISAACNRSSKVYIHFEKPKSRYIHTDCSVVILEECIRFQKILVLHIEASMIKLRFLLQ